MKRLIIAAAIVFAGPALAESSAPFEQAELDRALPSVPASVTAYAPIAKERMPFEQSQLDRGAIGEPEEVQLTQVGTGSYKSAEPSESVWANDHNFIAPAP